MKNKFLLGAFIAATLLCLFGCTKGPDQEPEPDPTTYILKADKTEVGINEIVTFSVETNTGEVVTDQFQMCSDTNCFGGYEISWSMPGTYTVHATLKADETITCENTITITVTGSVYTLSADKNEIYELETVVFSVTEIIDGVEQDKAPTGFKIGERGGDRYESLTHTFTEAGVYTIDAIRYNYRGEEVGRSQNTITIIVKEKEISGYEDNFYRRSLWAEGTSTTCTSCPSMVETIDYVMTYLQPDRIIPLAYHMANERDNDACEVNLWQPFYYIPDAIETALNIYFNNFPYYIIDWNANYAEDPGTVWNIEEGATAISHYVTASLASLPKSSVPGLAITTQLSGRDLSMTIKTTPRVEGEYLLGAVLVEDNKLTIQAKPEGMEEMLQMNIAHTAITSETGSEYAYLSLDRLGTLAPDQEYSYDYAITIPDRVSVENSRVVFFICQVDNTTQPFGFFCANATTVKVGESLDYEYEPIYSEEE